MSTLKKVGLAVGGLLLVAVASHAMAKGKENTAMAMPRFSLGKLSRSTACEIGCKAQPPAP